MANKSQCHYDESTKILSAPDSKLYYNPNCSIGKIAFEEMRRRPKNICQICDSDGTRLTNEEVRLHAIRLARFFQSMGLRQDDIVGYIARNTTYAMCVPLACFFTGIACHPVSPIADKGTAKKLFNITQPKVVFFDGQDMEKVRFISSDFESKMFTLSNHESGVPSILDLLKPTGDEHAFEPAELEHPDQNLILLCTSGTTGTPKVSTMPNSISFWRETPLLTTEDVQFVNATLDWFTSLISILACVICGVARVITARPLTAEYFFEIIEKYKVTQTVQSLYLATMIAKSANPLPEKLDSLRAFVIGGASPSVGLLKGLQKLVRNGVIIRTYACTEFCSGISSYIFSEYKQTSVGKIAPGVKLRIVNDNRENLGKNEVGEVCIYRSGYWGGYYKNPEATREVYDKDGWLYTGDFGYIDDDNDLFLLGRKKELLKYKGMQYYPADIEEIVEKIPGVKEVCVFGIADESVGESAAAVVVKIEGSTLKEQDVVDYVRKAIDAAHKHLNAGCKFVDEIPKTTSGKYQRNEAKKLFLGET